METVRVAIEVSPILRVLAWFSLYSTVTAVPPVLFGVLIVAIQSVNPSLADSITLFLFLFAIALILIGGVSLLPFARYAYTRGAALNPPIAMESMEEPTRKYPETKALGLLIGYVGLPFFCR